MMEGIQKKLKNLFPCEPYDIQMEIANKIYNNLSLDNHKLMIIESPTGTGKTYSLLVPLILWLNNNRSTMKPKEQHTNLSDTSKKQKPAWLSKKTINVAQRKLEERKNKQKNLIHISEIKNIKKKYFKQEKKQQDTDSFEQQGQKEGAKRKSIYSMITDRQILFQEEQCLPKIIFVSRTHSQLEQVISSINKMHLQGINAIQMASKEHLCTNSIINSHKNGITERCQRLLQKNQCINYHKHEIKQFFGKGVEDLKKLGQAHQLCPYFGVRNLLGLADVICVPYASILCQSMRLKSNLQIKNSIVVFDEGHNLMQIEKQLKSPSIGQSEIKQLSVGLDEYLQKYQDRLKIKNYNLLVHFLQILRSLLTVICVYRQRNLKSQTKLTYFKFSPLNFILQLNIKQIQIQKIIRYVNITNLDKKILNQSTKIGVFNMQTILDFILAISNPNTLNQIVVIKIDQPIAELKFMCFESEQFTKIIEQSRLTIVAGGTMEPLDDYDQIRSNLGSKVEILKYNHIIKNEQCKIIVLSAFKGSQIKFNYNNLNGKQIDHLMNASVQLIRKVKTKTEKGSGIVIFIQNYRLLELFRKAFQKENFYNQIIFDSQQQKSIFQQYKNAIENNLNDHTILISVMGGRLSEGINFSDRLARALVVFGLPYPNLKSAQIMEEMRFYDQKKSNFKGKDFYENECVRTINQTIGRGVRHINDYVTVYLCDVRFRQMKSRLSKWMKDRVTQIGEIQNI